MLLQKSVDYKLNIGISLHQQGKGNILSRMMDAIAIISHVLHDLGYQSIVRLFSLKKRSNLLL
ncbi:hypothetical protein AU476_28330 [Cupriavidus sp. UYMSc13B]|nr:hypothetical protein AU476_28330 [Cupriavidus sp. UYMSc13B]